MKKILIGVTGSIAAYKVAELIRLLKKSGHDVRVVMTRSASEIITPMTLQVLSQHEVRVDLFDHENEAKIDHIALARWGDQIIIAPATANFMAKLAIGLADDLLSTLCLATDVPIAIAPAMNHLMWKNLATQSNLQTLLARGIHLIDPEEGSQACGELGKGRMAEAARIVHWLNSQREALQNKIFKGKTIVITAGPTIERIDPVRFISNDSSGKMGYALAKNARDLGADVILVTGKTSLSEPKGMTVIQVKSAQNMYDSVMACIASADWFIATAAVSDYTVAQPALQKLKKSSNQGLTLELVQNPDILKSVAALSSKPFCIGFAAETDNVVEYAKAKRLRKGVDLIVANDVSNETVGFNSDFNAVTLIGEVLEQNFQPMLKDKLAYELLIAALEYEKKQKSYKAES